MTPSPPRRDNPRKDRDHPRKAGGKDPTAGDKPKIDKPGVRTMRVDKGKGLPPPPKIHPHHRKNAPRQRKIR